MKKNEDELSPDDLTEIEGQLRGNTLVVYWYMVRSDKPLGAREIQRAVGLSSSSLALHHLNKLIELGLVGKDKYGAYVVARRVSLGLLGFFVGTGVLFMPRFLLYALLNTGLLVSSLVVFSSQLDAVVITLFTSLTISTLAFWFETAKMWRTQPL